MPQIGTAGQGCGVYRVPVCGELLSQVLLAPISAHQTKVKISFHPIPSNRPCLRHLMPWKENG